MVLKDKNGNLLCKECGARLEPEPDEDIKPEIFNMFGVKEKCNGYQRYDCRVCEFQNEYIIEVN